MSRSTWIAVAIFGLLLAGTAWVMMRKPEAGIRRVSLGGVQTSQVDRIVITGPKAIELTKKGEMWRVPGGREADEDMVKSLLDTATRINSSDVLTEDPNRMGEFELDAAKGQGVKLYAGSQLVADFSVGKSVAGGAAVGHDGVAFKVSNVYPAAFAHTATEWLQRRLFKDNLDEVARVNVQMLKEMPYTILHKDAGWELVEQAKADQAPSDFRFDAGAGQALASALLNLRADEILAADPGVEVTKLKAEEADTLTYFMKNKAETPAGTAASHSVLLGAKKDDKGVYAKIEGAPDIYVLPEYVASSVRKKLTDLRDLSLFGNIDAGKIDRLVVNDGKKKVTFSKEGEAWALAKGEKMPPGFQLDPQKVARRVVSVVHARAQGLAKVQASRVTGLNAPKMSVSLSVDGKQEWSVGFGNSCDEQPNSVYVRGPDGKVYFAGNYLRDSLTGGLDSFKRVAEVDPLTQIDPATLQGLPPDVRENLAQQIAQKKREQEMLKTMQQQQHTGSPHP